MSNISISLTANTSAYVKRIKDARTETDRNIIKMEQRIDQFAQDVNKNFTSVGGSIDAMIGGLRNMKGGGYIAAVAGIGFAATSAMGGMKQLATQTIATQREIKIAAERAGVTSSEMQKLGMITESVGISMEKFGDITKDVQDKLGDYLTTGGGAFVDFFDVMGEQVGVTAQELQNLSGPDVLMKVVQEMERVGASGAQMTWVLESLGSDASNLLPLLKDNAAGFRELRERLDELESVPDTLADAAIEVQIMDTAFRTMWDQFGVMMTNEFKDFYELIGGAAMKLSNMWAEYNNKSLTASYLDDFKAGKLQINTSDDADTIKNKVAAAKQYAEDRFKNNVEYIGKEKQLWSQGEAERHKMEIDLKANRHKMSLSEIEAQNKLIQEKMKEQDELKMAIIKKHDKAAYDIIQRGSRIETINSIDPSNATKTGKENLEKRFKWDKGAGVEGADDEIKRLTPQVENARKQVEAEKKKLSDMIAKYGVTLEELNNAQALADLGINEDEARALTQRLTQQQKAVDDSIKIANDGAKALEDIEKFKVDTAKKTADAEKKAADQKAREKKRENDEKLKAEKQAIQLEQRVKMEALQNEIKAARTVADKIIANKNYQYAVIGQMEAANLERINARVASEAITEEQAAIETAELTRQTAAMRFGIDEQAYLAEMEAKQNRYYESHELDIANAEAKLEWYKEQKDRGHITDVEYAEKKKELEEDINHSKEQLQSEYFNIVSGSMSDLAGAFEQGSKQAKIAFAAEKGVKIAEAMLLMESNALKAKAAAPNPAVGEALASASRIKDGVSIAAMAATAIGQFHAGTDEVDQTGSYILKKGERVVQETANKDLTAFLEGNGKSSGEMVVNADMIIQGDANIDENKFKAMLVQHRENITQAVRLAQRENPSLR